MPCLDTGMIRTLVETSVHPITTAIVYRHGPYIEPLHACYSKGIAPIIAAVLSRGKRDFRSLLAEVEVTYIELPASHPCFSNINVPDDLEMLKK
jgi:molybdopterin-guanine dinucleotide biosynthesis protein A